ncbi:MAG: hypothetical protein NVS1B13_02080 [Flavisolibacter sp.]
MKKIALIPARYAASRFPGKLLQMLGNKTVIRTTYEATQSTGLFDEVIVVTDHASIYKEITSFGGQALMSKKVHESGTDRIAEAAENLSADLIVNVQGDTPFVTKQCLENLLVHFDLDPSVQVGSLMKVLKEDKLIADPNYVKVCTDKRGNALFFSRSIIPFPRNSQAPLHMAGITS